MRSRSTKIQTLRLNISGTVGAIEVILLPNERCSPKVSTYVLKQRSSLGGQGQGQGHLKVITQMDSKLNQTWDLITNTQDLAKNYNRLRT